MDKLGFESMADFENEINITMDSVSENESFSRVALVSFISKIDPTINDVNDIKTALSEAVTNAIIHGYENKKCKVYLNFYLKGSILKIEIIDKGIGIDNIPMAMEPLYTSKPEMERSGMGFSVMEAFMDYVNVVSEKNVGTTITMYKDMSND